MFDDTRAALLGLWLLNSAKFCSQFTHLQKWPYSPLSCPVGSLFFFLRRPFISSICVHTLKESMKMRQVVPCIVPCRTISAFASTYSVPAMCQALSWPLGIETWIKYSTWGDDSCSYTKLWKVTLHLKAIDASYSRVWKTRTHTRTHRTEGTRALRGQWKEFQEEERAWPQAVAGRHSAWDRPGSCGAEGEEESQGQGFLEHRTGRAGLVGGGAERRGRKGREQCLRKARSEWSFTLSRVVLQDAGSWSLPRAAPAAPVFA